MELVKCYWVRQISSLINVLRTSLQYRYYISGDLILTNYLQYVSAVVFYLGTWMKVGFFFCFCFFNAFIVMLFNKPAQNCKISFS